MRKILKLSMLMAVVACIAATPGDTPMTKKNDGTIIVNSTTLCKARGFRKTTPVEVHIRKGKVLKVVPLKNEETPAYFEKVNKKLLPLYENISIKDAQSLSRKTDIDGCTGATYSTVAVQKNISAALDYYEANK